VGADYLQRAAVFVVRYGKWADSFSPDSGYTLAAPGVPLALTVRGELPSTIEEGWRRLFLDVTAMPTADDVTDVAFVDELSRWLVKEQPITLAINDDDTDYKLALRLFERTCQVVYSVGTSDQPALSCQARPQEAEVFGEFAPRRQLNDFTKFPVIVPSSTPGYHSQYARPRPPLPSQCSLSCNLKCQFSCWGLSIADICRA
jgi:hypothetical protein